MDRKQLAALWQQEQQRFRACHPRSMELAAQAQSHQLFGVPMHWMRDWSGPTPLYLQTAQGNLLQDVDSHHLIDFCLGDSGAMFGHAPPPVQAALQAHQGGYSTMLPNADGIAVADLLQQRFALPFWQFALSASDANRFVLRWLRAATGRSKLLVFNGCYHGTVDDVFVDLVDGQARQRASLLGQVHDLCAHTVVIEFNDLPALEKAVQGGDIACVLAEPVMTNIGMVLPEPDFWQQASALLRHYQVPLVLDETHTLSSGPGGWAREHGIQADALILGKAIAGGFPLAAYGFSAAWAEKVVAAKAKAVPGHSGIGTTLSANALGLAALRANLEQVMTDQAYAQMLAQSTVLATGLRALFAERGLDWCVTQVGARCEFQFCPHPPRNGSAAATQFDEEMERLIHLYLQNRGVLITPFHNMLLCSPQTEHEHVFALLKVFAACLDELRCGKYM